MDEFEVNCVTKPCANSPHEAITHIGNTVTKWRVTRESAITRIESKAEAFYTVDRATGKCAYLFVVRQVGKAPYLRAYGEGKWTESLLTLEDCGEECRVLSGG
jgi:hypothetical protein